MCQWCVYVLFGAYRCGLAKLCVYVQVHSPYEILYLKHIQLIVSSENEENFLRFLNEQVIIWQYIVAAVDYCCMMVWTASVDFTCNVLHFHSNSSNSIVLRFLANNIHPALMCRRSVRSLCSRPFSLHSAICISSSRRLQSIGIPWMLNLQFLRPILQVGYLFYILNRKAKFVN